MDCVCQHPQESHWRLKGRCLTADCSCESFHLTTAIQISTLLSESGEGRVSLVFGDTQLQLHPDAAAEIALNLLSAAYRMRAEIAVYNWAVAHNADVHELLGGLRQ